MYFYDKKVVYLSYMEEGLKVKSAGYVKMEVRDQICIMDMHVKAGGLTEKRKCNIVAQSEEKEIIVGAVFIENGEGCFMGQFPVQSIGRYEDKISYQEIESIKIILEQESFIEGRIGTPGINMEMQSSSVIRVPGKEFIPAEMQSADMRKKMEEVRISPNKWQQLLNSYKQIHPYGDERTYVSLEPKDFIVMTGEFQHLANNSFLLHGFYNYRHIILGLENKEKEEIYYLGVPGVYYEREKMVALMFGFEAFECEGGKAENAKFGYYLKQVKI